MEFKIKIRINAKDVKVSDDDIEYHMNVYMGLFERKFQQTQNQRKQIERLLRNAAVKIQNMFRRFRIKRRTRSAIKIQRWWRNALVRQKQRKNKINRFIKLYYGLIIVNFMKAKTFPNKYKTKQTNKTIAMIQTKTKSIGSPMTAMHYRILGNITQYFPQMIAKKSAMVTQYRYLTRYRQYLREKFNKDWQDYEKKLTAELRKEMNKKWVLVDPKSKSRIYLNEWDKQVDGDRYISNKLDGIYSEFHNKMQAQDAVLQGSQAKIQQGIEFVTQLYQRRVLHGIKV